LNSKKIAVPLIIALLSLFAFASATTLIQASEPAAGTDSNGIGPSWVRMGSIVPVVTEVGKVSVSIDGLGVYSESTGTIQVEKPSGATVRSAYMAAATTGFTGVKLANGDITIDGVGVNWDVETSSSISSWNYWAEVTSIVKPKIDAAPAGRIDFTIAELISSYNVDGEILVVIFDDPNQTTDNTVVLLFGAQDIAGDTFAIGLAEPIDLSDPNLGLDFSLGISYSYQQGDYQYSLVNVNGVRMTTWAGGEDDGGHANGKLITVGGLDDSNANPADPFATPKGNWRYDDELYNLKPFVKDGDTSINVYTQNPSADDNIFFAALSLKSTVAVVGEGIVLGPVSASNPLGTPHTLTATVQDDLGNPIVGRDVTFEVKSGPHAGMTHTEPTDASGHAYFTYTGTSAGTDVIVASFMDVSGKVVTSNEATKDWTLATATVCTVWTTDVGGTPKGEFTAGETVYVHWNANGMVDMTVYAPDGVTVDQQWLGLGPSGTVSFVPSHGNGIYSIQCTGAPAVAIAVSTFLVVPEVPLGAAMAVVAGLAVLVPFALIRRRQGVEYIQ